MPLSPQDALIYVMVMTSASDRAMNDQEMSRIGQLVKRLPVFSGFDVAELPTVAERCATMMNEQATLDGVLDAVAEALPARLRDTAYALAVEIAAADFRLEQEELRLLDIIEERLEVDQLVAAAIKAAARARYRRV